MEEKQSFEEFSKQVRNTGKPVKGKVSNSWGVYSAYKAIRKHHWFDIGRPLLEHEFYTIIRSVNKLLAEELVNGNTVKLPLKMGKLEVRKFKTGAYMKNDKLVINYPVDWGETLKLWYQDEEARKNKTLMRREYPYIYYIRYCTEGHDANYVNKYFYGFSVNTNVKKALQQNVKNGKIDTLW